MWLYQLQLEHQSEQQMAMKMIATLIQLQSACSGFIKECTTFKPNGERRVMHSVKFCDEEKDQKSNAVELLWIR